MEGTHARPGRTSKKRLREALGNTLSDEFVDVILGKLVEASVLLALLFSLFSEIPSPHSRASTTLG